MESTPGHADGDQRRWQSRRSAWLRDELILALDLYRRTGRNPDLTDLRELSDVLRAIPIEQELAENPKFRNPRAVALKLANFVAIDPDATTAGMARGGRGDRDAFSEFWTDPARLAVTAAAIRANLASVQAGPLDRLGGDEMYEALEGQLLTRVHRVRERNRNLVDRRKAKALKEHGRLQCQGCGFDFAETYGIRGASFIECHHTVPVSTLRPGTKTKLADLALVCSNCHRMIHRRARWLTIDELRDLVSSDAK